MAHWALFAHVKLGAPHTWLTKQKVVDAGIAATLAIFGTLLLAGAVVHLMAPVAIFTVPLAVAYRSSSEPAPPSRGRPAIPRGSAVDREALRSGSNAAIALPRVAHFPRATNSLPARGFTPRPPYPSVRAERPVRVPAGHASVEHAPTIAAVVHSPKRHGSPTHGSYVDQPFAVKLVPRAAGARTAVPAAPRRSALAAFRTRHPLPRQLRAGHAAVRRNGAHVVGARTPSRTSLLRQRSVPRPASNATPEPPLGYDRRLSFVSAPSEAAGVARADGIRVRGRPIPSAPPVSAAATPTR